MALRTNTSQSMERCSVEGWSEIMPHDAHSSSGELMQGPPTHGWRALLDRVRRHPMGLLRRAVAKRIIGPMRYGRGADYDARRYWDDRLAKYGASLRGAGHEGLSERENAELNHAAADVLLRELRRAGLDLPQCAVLDIGPGNGFATALMRRAGVRSYLGLDISSTLFERLQQDFPSYHFQCADICEQKADGRFDLILMLDVLEHIVDDSRLSNALANARSALKPAGVLAVALPIADGSPRAFFYLRLWDLNEIVCRLPGFAMDAAVPWRDGQLLLARIAGSSDS